jgi:glycerophosphoryl diester phosphodiesterase
MDPQPRSVVRIAHAYGNNQASLTQALHADIDMIEADMWYRSGDLRIHHEQRVSWLPILMDVRMPTHRPGRFAVPLGKYFVRPDIGTIHLDELLRTVDGRKRLLLDVKGRYKPKDLEAYVQKLVGKIRRHGAESWVVVCGQTYSVLHRLRQVAPDLEVRYSVEWPYQWERFEVLMEHGVRRACMSYRTLEETKVRILTEAGVDVYFWTVDNPETARTLVNLGADGIISHDLTLLVGLPRTAAATSE